VSLAPTNAWRSFANIPVVGSKGETAASVLGIVLNGDEGTFTDLLPVLEQICETVHRISLGVLP
jgi:3-hydroxyisobutyrate dehydrogenase-like beta-hydroxyacid dehydrogenase